MDTATNSSSSNQRKNEEPTGVTSKSASANPGEDSLTGYVHQLSKVKDARNEKKTTFFNFLVQTSETSSQSVVCYSPDKRKDFLNYQQQHQPVSILGGQLSPNKRSSSKMDFTVKKKSKLQSVKVNFQYNPSFEHNLTTVDNISSLLPFDTVDVKVKIISKTEEKQKVIVHGDPCFKVDCVVTDKTGTIRLEAWEAAIDELQRGKSYHIKNLKVKMFNDKKYINTNEESIIEQIDDIVTNTDVTTGTDFQDSVITGKVIALDLIRNPSCPLCNATNNTASEDQEIINCKGCKSTMLSESLVPKLVCKLSILVDKKITSYSAFNDALQSFFILKGIDAQLGKMSDGEIKVALLKAGDQTMLVDKCAKIVTQFL